MFRQQQSSRPSPLCDHLALPVTCQRPSAIAAAAAAAASRAATRYTLLPSRGRGNLWSPLPPFPPTPLPPARNGLLALLAH